MENARSVAALLFLTGALYGLDVFSSVHSSPYTAEVRGGDAENAARVRHYVAISVGVAAVTGLAAAVIAGKGWPVVGVAVSVAFMWWLYSHALARGACDTEEAMG